MKNKRAIIRRRPFCGMRISADTVFQNIFYILGALYLLKIFVRFVPIELSLILIELYLLLYKRGQKLVFRYSRKDRLIFIYIFACLFPAGALFSEQYGLQAFFVGIRNMVLPIFFYFCAEIYQDYPEQKRMETKKKWMKGLLFCLLTGLLLHIWNPLFYHDYMRTVILNVYMTDIDIYYGGRVMRFMGIFLSSQMAGIASVAGACLAADVYRKHIVKKYISTGVFGITALLSFQRAAWVLMVLVICYDVMKHIREQKTVFSILIFVLAGFTALVFFGDTVSYALNMNQDGAYAMSVIERIQSLSGVVSERFSFSFAVEAIEAFWASPVFGNGLAYLGRSLDANYHRILADLGLCGFLPFCMIILRTAFLTVRNKHTDSTGLLPLCIAVNALGAPMFDSILTGGLFFWMMTGCLWKGERNICTDRL